jgi:hypothetical protein
MWRVKGQQEQWGAWYPNDARDILQTTMKQFRENFAERGAIIEDLRIVDGPDSELPDLSDCIARAEGTWQEDDDL